MTRNDSFEKGADDLTAYGEEWRGCCSALSQKPGRERLDMGWRDGRNRVLCVKATPGLDWTGPNRTGSWGCEIGPVIGGRCDRMRMRVSVGSRGQWVGGDGFGLYLNTTRGLIGMGWDD